MSQGDSATAGRLIDAAKRLRDDVDEMTFGPPVTHVYNPLRYAWRAHRQYLSQAQKSGIRALFVGMNPGPWGMAQTGVPFGEVAAVREWIGIEAKIDQPAEMHPKRPVEGFECGRSEVSGRRLWGLFGDRFGSAERFFSDYFVANYCPLVFMEASARNRTPDKLASAERDALSEACDRHLAKVIDTLKPRYAIGVGVYAETCLKRVLEACRHEASVSRILHPSPASPAANKDWAGKVTTQLIEAGVWTGRG